jgi:hypothetical protein
LFGKPSRRIYDADVPTRTDEMNFVHAFRRARGTTPAVFRRGTGPAAR